MATAEDMEIMAKNKPREKNMLVRARAIAKELNLDMKITEVELQADGKKGIFYYIAEDRVDFRELIKIYAYDFNVKVEMMQIGIRQEAAKVGGIGSCGRELCCSTWLSDFKSVSTVAARYQNLSINQAKLSGQCGRLKCCLNYELDTYMDALKGFPNDAEKIQIASGTAFLQKKDIFKNLMWYSLKESNTQYPLTIERVKEIKNLNAQGIKPEELGAEELEKVNKNEPKEEFVDVVGAFSLKTLEEKERKDKQARNTAKQQANKANANKAATPQGPRPANPNAVQNKGPRPPRNSQQENRTGNANATPNENPKQNSNPNPNQNTNPNANPNRPKGPRPQGPKPNQGNNPNANSNPNLRPNPRPNPNQKPNQNPSQGPGNTNNSTPVNPAEASNLNPNPPTPPSVAPQNPASDGTKKRFQPNYGDKKPPTTE
jgi:cell fate regulator YaaT (PSP1 superfamily)